MATQSGEGTKYLAAVRQAGQASTWLVTTLALQIGARTRIDYQLRGKRFGSSVANIDRDVLAFYRAQGADCVAGNEYRAELGNGGAASWAQACDRLNTAVDALNACADLPSYPPFARSGCSNWREVTIVIADLRDMIKGLHEVAKVFAELRAQRRH